MRGLTLNHEPNIGRPYASRDRYHEPLPVPYGDAGGSHEQLMAALPHCRGRRTCGARSRATQRQRPSTQRAENGKTTEKKHRQTFIPRAEHDGGGAGRTHELEDVLDLKTWLVRMRVHMG